MRRGQGALLAALFLLGAAHAQPAADTDGPLPPSQAFPGLFQTVATAGLYEPKAWADAVPRRDAAAILADWRAEAPRGAALRAFVEANFDVPAETTPSPLDLPADRTLTEHVALLWPHLTRGPEVASGSRLALPAAHVVPGGRFRELYYWDSYFTLLGLPDEALRADMAANFAALLTDHGLVPNGSRTYYLSRSQPPFLWALIGLLDEDEPAAAWAEHLDVLQAEHAFWMEGAEALARGEASGRVVRLPDGAVLNRYWDDREAPRDESYVYDLETARAAARPAPVTYRELRAGAESGWDYSSRWLADGQTLATIETTRVVPVDLNALLYGLESAIAQGCAHAGDETCAGEHAALAAARATAIRTHLWNEAGGHFDDYDLNQGALRDRPTAAMLYPLFVGLATPGEGARTAATVREHLLAPGGILPTPNETGQQWDAPNGWAPHQWLAVEGLRRAGQGTLAAEIARRWTATVARSFCETGKLTEKYDVLTVREGGGGEYPNQDGFGWTNGVTVRLIATEPGLAPLGQTRVLGDPAACAADVDARLD